MMPRLADQARHIKHKIFKPRDLWTIALYVVQRDVDVFELEKYKPFEFIGESGLRRSRSYQSTVADPFLCSKDDQVFLFYEMQTDFGVGEIHAVSVDENGVKTRYGCVLKEKHHMSYPQVFHLDGDIWMIPETAADQKVWLYKASKFPKKWEKARILLDEELVDTSIIINDDGIYLLGTNRKPELRLFHSENIHGEFVDAKISVTRDESIVRNAGMPIRVSGKLYRLAQNCQNFYGENINILEVNQLKPNIYSEALTVRDLFKRKAEWMTRGCHHISICPFKGGFMVAVDGKRRDSVLNNVSLAIIESFSGAG